MKKGFTLIELLAVIVILAVIALIATPVIMNAISNAKQGAWKDAAYGIIKATENVYAKNFSEVTDQVDTFFLYESGVMTSYPSGKTIDYKGSVPQDGGIVLHADGSVTLAIHDGENCAVKAKSATTVTVTTTDKATCISNIYYKQASAPFNTIVANGDFSNGTAGWVGGTGTIAASNKTLFSIGNGAEVYPQFSQGTSNPYALGQKLYFKSKVRVTNSDSNQITYMLVANNMTTATANLVTSPMMNVYYDNSAILTSTSGTSSNYTIYIYHRYPTPALANGKIMEVKYFIVINLTNAYGAGNEPTKEQMDNNLNKVWIDSSTNTPKRFTAGGWINF